MTAAEILGALLSAEDFAIGGATASHAGALADALQATATGAGSSTHAALAGHCARLTAALFAVGAFHGSLPTEAECARWADADVEALVRKGWDIVRHVVATDDEAPPSAAH